MKAVPVEKLKWFEQWMKDTGEGHPDFDNMKSVADLPKLLQFEDGSPVRNFSDWEKRTEELKKQLNYSFLGKHPDTVPSIVSAEILSETYEQKATLQKIKLTFDTKNNATFDFELMIPDGEGPFPVFMTQSNQRRWGLLALSRGYIACIYPGADINDQTLGFKEAYPDCDWALLPRRAWLGSRTLDYVMTLKLVDKGKIAFIGHSRNGKQSLIAAAYDKRITACISSSSGSGGAAPYRFSSESAFQESTEYMTRKYPEWFHPRLRFFTGREDKLPTDCHALMGLIAPRACLISSGINDRCESSFAIERSCDAAREAYKLFNKLDGIQIRWRDGDHGISPEDVLSYVDWLDHVFGRSVDPIHEERYHTFDWTDWKFRSTADLNVPFTSPKTMDLQEKKERILWSFGDAPPLAYDPGGGKYGSYMDPLSKLLFQDIGKPSRVKRKSFGIGDSLKANLYYREDMPMPAPVVIWLPPFSYPIGYSGAYMRSERIFSFLADNGYAVITLDQLGFGYRILEGANFYKRYPNWSKMGKMIRDTITAVDYATGELSSDDVKSSPLTKSNAANNTFEPALDANRIYCVGYSLGGMVGLYATALDKRITGVASFSGFTPLRTDTDDKHTGGIRRLWDWYGLQPRLGLFHGRESEIPFDFDDVLSLVAPRPCFISSPIHDRENDLKDITSCVERVRPEWTRQGAEQTLKHESPNDYNRFQPEQHRNVLDWLNEVNS